MDRNSAFFSATQSICPKCRKTVQAKILFREGQVLLQKRCLEHGEFEGLLSSNIDYWVKSLTYTKPGTLPHKFSTVVERGCPDDCGLCPDHEQHTCSPIIEISNKCDLKCPVCIVWNENSYNMSLDEFKRVIDGLIEKEGSLELALLSGGEPTLHPEFFELCSYARSQSAIKRLLISSHGIRMARDREFAQQFKEMGLYLSLQFDSLTPANYLSLRGASLYDLKMKCLETCEALNIPTILVPTVAKGFNDHELGSIVDLAMRLDFVTSVTLQPMAFTGAGGSTFGNPMDKLTQYDIHQRLAEQTSWLKKEDFLPIPCSHPSCYTACYVLKGESGSPVPLNRLGDLSCYLDMLTNRAIIDPTQQGKDFVQDAIYKLWSAQAITVDSEPVLRSLKSLLNEYEKCRSSEDLSHVWQWTEKRVKAIFIHAFMDEYDFEVSRIRKCCTHYALPDGRLMPGCPYNNVHRFNDKRLMGPR